MTKKTPSPVQQARERLIVAVERYGDARDKAAFYDGYRADGRHDSIDAHRRSIAKWGVVGTCRAQVERATTAYARAVRREEKGKR